MSGCYKGTLDDERTVEVDYRVTSWGSGPSWDHPGDPVEIEIEAFEVDGGEFDPSEDERDRLEREICELLDSEGPPPLDDDV